MLYLKLMGNIGRRGIDWESHHILFERAAWESNSEGSVLRQNPNLIVDMYVAPHDELHAAIPFVTWLDAVQTWHINQEFKRKPDPLKNINELIRCIHRSIEHFGNDPEDLNLYKSMRVSNGLMAIKSIEAQIPYIRDGMVKEHLKPKRRRVKTDRRKGGSVC